MPDPLLILRAMAAAFVAAAAVLLVLGRAGRSRPALSWALGVGVAFFLGAVLLNPDVNWPPREDRERLLTVLLPAAVFVELLAAFVPAWLGWVLRVLVAAAAAPVLLYGSRYLTEPPGPGSKGWAPEEMALQLSAMAAALLGVWAALALLLRRQPTRSAPLALAVVAAGAGLGVMLSGNASDGQMGLPLAAALTGAAAASLILRVAPSGAAAVSVGIVALFGLLVNGRFFAQMTTAHAALLLAAPLLCWLPELPGVRRLRPWLRGGLRLALVAVPLALVLTQAYAKYTEESQSTSQPGEPTLEDYMNFGQ